MATIATRLSNTGTLLVNGGFDEASLGSGSISLNGTNQYLTVPSSSAFVFGTNAYTIEMWVYPNNNSQNAGLFQLSSSATYVQITPTNQLSIQLFNGYIQFGSDTAWNVGNGVAANAYVANRWYHVAMTRQSGGLTKFFINGVQVHSLTETTNYTGSYLVVGGFYQLPTYVLNGNLSNFRIVNGTALYTANFTPPTGILPAVANTSLLLNVTDSTNFIKDNGPNKFTVTNANTATFNTSSPFNQNSSKTRTTTDTVFSNVLDEFTGAPVVDNSLVLWLDAGQTTSYPGTGTTWTDLSGSGTNGTLTSGPTYNASNGGSIVFDGVDDLVTVSDKGNLPVFTVEAWVNFISVPTNGQYPAIITNIYTGSPNVLNFSLGFNGVDGGFAWDGKIKIGFYDGTWRSTDGIIPTTNTWYHLVGTYNGSTLSFYINSVLSYTKSYVGTPSSSGAGIRIGRRWDTANYINGYIPLVRLYNRALSSAEIVQNYNALQSRYGLPSITSTQMPVVQRQHSSGTLLVNGEFDEFTGAPIVDSGLKLWLDAAQTTSYPGTGTTWTDLSGNSQNFTLYNSPTFSTKYGGELLFSGSNDYARIRNSSSIDLLSSSGTVEVWFRTISSTLGGGTYARLISFSDEASTGSDTTSTQGVNNDYSDYFLLAKNNTAESLAGWYKNNPAAFGPATLVNTNNYFNAVVTWSTSGASMTFNFYLNGTNTNTSTVTQSGYSINASTITIGQNCAGALTNPLENSSCAFSVVKLYNRALSPDEVSQNFNALRRRYGI